MEDSEIGAEELGDARTFWELSKGEPVAEKEDIDLGHCKLWVRTEKGLPGKVGFVRGTGMLVTTRQKGLIRFSGFRDFAALCVFEAPKGNELLRRMENPQHDQFEPDRLPKGEREHGRKALKRITDWVRSEIKNTLARRRGKKGRYSQNSHSTCRTISQRSLSMNPILSRTKAITNLDSVRK